MLASWLMIAATATAQTALGARLEAALAAAHPLVTRWEIEPLDAVRALGASADSRIVRLGARSAVAGADRRLLWFSARGYRRVQVAASALAPRAPLARGFTEAERDVLGVGCEPVADPAVLEGMRTRRALHAGDAICADAIEPVPAIVRGADVAVVYVGPRVRLATVAVAERDANVGDTLIVRNPKTHERYRAIGVGENEVKIHE